LLYGQLSGATKLREIVTGLESQATRLYHVGGKPLKRTTLSDANRDRPYQVFSELCAAMMAQAHRGLRRTMKDAVRLIDSTSVRLSRLSADWAGFSADWSGVKAHIVYDPNADRPVYFAVTTANVNDHRRQGDADRTGGDLCIRPRLLRLWLLGAAQRRRQPFHYAAEEEHAADGRARERGSRR
jgi:hypothetical protein